MLILARVFPALRSKKGFLLVWKRGEYPLRGKLEMVYLAESYRLDYLLGLVSLRQATELPPALGQTHRGSAVESADAGLPTARH